MYGDKNSIKALQEIIIRFVIILGQNLFNSVFWDFLISLELLHKQKGTRNKILDLVSCQSIKNLLHGTSK
jgi:hypothetical protein